MIYKTIAHTALCLSLFSTMIFGMDTPPSNQWDFSDLPLKTSEKLTLCALMSQAAYKLTDAEFAPIEMELNDQGYRLITTKEDPSVDFRAQAWKNPTTNQIIISYRGTVPSSFQNILSDIGISISASCKKEDPIAYLTEHTNSRAFS